MRETFTSGSVGRAPGNRCLYPEPDCLPPPLLRRSGFRQQVSASVRLSHYQSLVHWCGFLCAYTVEWARQWPLAQHDEVQGAN